MNKIFSLDGTIFKEDVVYQHGSSQSSVAHASLEADVITEATIKFELSDNVMIMSLTTDYEWGGKRYQDHKRDVYLGEYKYDSNGLLNFAGMNSKTSTNICPWVSISANNKMIAR